MKDQKRKLSNSTTESPRRSKRVRKDVAPQQDDNESSNHKVHFLRAPTEEEDAWVSLPILEMMDCVQMCDENLKFECVAGTVWINEEKAFVVRVSECLFLTHFQNLDLSEIDLTDVAMEDIPRTYASFLANRFGISPKSIETFPVPLEDVCPKHQSDLTVVPEQMMEFCHFKLTSFTEYKPGCTDNINHLVLAEAKACELLMKNPHPSIAKYWGCHVINGEIRALCFGDYIMSLHDRLATGVPLDAKRCLKSIRDGILHMHSLGLMHNNINPYSIVMDASDNPVIIDFDSCTRKGEKIVKGVWYPDSCIKNAKTGSPKNDFYALKKLEEYFSGHEEAVERCGGDGER
ncbi:hypothetical protein FPSE5266_12024 [Fusarium pseudograminearum]|nr:hypothetical protein FPSE5266_12024 [Fusarium pseudograminearum]